MLEIRVGGLTIKGRPDHLDSRVEGLFVGRGGFDGWDDGGGAIRRESVARPSSHGEFDLPVFQGARVFSIEGHALAWSEEDLGELRSKVMGIGAAGDRLRVSVTHQGETLWATARRGALPTFKDAGVRAGRLKARFLLQFVAPDPRKYGGTKDFPAGVAAYHRGNFPATPQLLIGAGAGGYTVTAGGRQIIVGASAPAGAHRIDLVTGGLYTGAGVRVPGAVTVYQPWTIPPGGAGVAASITGSRSLVQRVTDTYV